MLSFCRLEVPDLFLHQKTLQLGIFTGAYSARIDNRQMVDDARQTVFINRNEHRSSTFYRGVGVRVSSPVGLML